MQEAVQQQQEHDYPVLFVVPEQGAGPAAWTVAERLRYRGLRVIIAQTWDDLRHAVEAHSLAGAARIGTALISWDLLGSERDLEARLDEIYRLSGQPPIVLLSEGPAERPVPPAIAGRTVGSFWLHADSPHFVADQVEWLVRTYALRSQVVGALGSDTSQYGDIGRSGEIPQAGLASGGGSGDGQPDQGGAGGQGGQGGPGSQGGPDQGGAGGQGGPGSQGGQSPQPGMPATRE